MNLFWTTNLFLKMKVCQNGSNSERVPGSWPHVHEGVKVFLRCGLGGYHRQHMETKIPPESTGFLSPSKHPQDVSVSKKRNWVDPRAIRLYGWSRSKWREVMHNGCLNLSKLTTVMAQFTFRWLVIWNFYLLNVNLSIQNIWKVSKA